ncbi:hypothetical protein AB9E13_34160, partial [Rhizobium leguminosarum]
GIVERQQRRLAFLRLGEVADIIDDRQFAVAAVWARAVKRAGEEETDIAELIAEEGRKHEVMPWDWRHYAEKIRARKFDFSEAELKP